MAFNHTILESLIDDGGTLSAPSRSLAGNGTEKLDKSIAASQVDEQADVSFVAANVQSLWILSSQDMTLETNNGTSPADTINLKANIPYKWDVNGYGSNPFTVDVTAFFLTNLSSSDAATFTFRVLLNN